MNPIKVPRINVTVVLTLLDDGQLPRPSQGEDDKDGLKRKHVLNFVLGAGSAFESDLFQYAVMISKNF